MSESLTDKLTRHGMAASASHVYGGEAELLFAARDRIAELEAALRFLCQMCLVASVPYDDEADFHRALLLAQKSLGTFDPRYRQDE